jgi:alpha-glucosidase (family GH31 glycosyl hydrolase)
MGPELKYVGEKPFDPITLNIYPDEKGSASVTLYEDDGISPAYKQQAFRRTTMRVESSGGGFVVISIHRRVVIIPAAGN